jgi:hypothetical protein
LSVSGYHDVAKAYILYRKQQENARAAEKTMLDYRKLVDSYLHADDWRVKENSTVNYSIGGLILSNSGAITANYWLSRSTTRKWPTPTGTRSASARSVHALRLLCRLEPETVDHQWPGRSGGQDILVSGEASFHVVQPDG